MSLASVQPFLEQAFEFLRDRKFSVDQITWEKFYTEQGITSEQLDTAKSELSSKLANSVDEEKTELLKQIFCCDPFDAKIIKELRDIFADQPDPFKSWSYDLANHLMTISVQLTPEKSNIKSQEINGNDQENKIINSKPKTEFFKVITASSIVGICVMLGLIINNNSNRQPNLAVNTPSVDSSPKSMPFSSQNPTPQVEQEKGEIENQAKTTATIRVSQAVEIIESLYDAVSSKQFDRAYVLMSPQLQSQFNPDFFEQFTQVTVENLRVTAQTNNSISLIGSNTYFYPDGSTQRERRSYLVSSLDGQPKIINSRFIKVTKLRR